MIRWKGDPSHDRRSGGSAVRADLLHVTTIPMSLTFLVGQIGYMKERGLRVQAVSSPGPDLGAFGRAEGIPVSAVEMVRRIAPTRDLRALTGLVSLIRRTSPTIVHAHTPKGGLLGMVAATLARTPVRIYHMRGLPVLGVTGLRRTVLRSAERTACGLAHQVFCVSHSLRMEAIREGLCPAEKVKVLAAGSGNGVDGRRRFNPDALGEEARLATRRRLGIPAGATVLGFVGRVVRDKGVVELAESWRALRREHPDAHVVLVGPFEAEDPVPEATEALLREDARVHLVGMDWNTPPLYAAMDLVVLPTYREGFPNVPLEAAAMRLPVVATRVPGCVDAVDDGVTGILVPPRNPAALARAIGRYLSNPALRMEHGFKARERVLREFRPERIWESLYREYSRLLRERRLGTHIPLEELQDSLT